jgi:hypothetical protein
VQADSSGTNPALINGTAHFLNATDTWGVPCKGVGVGAENVTVDAVAEFRYTGGLGMSEELANRTIGRVPGARLFSYADDADGAKGWAVPCNTSVPLTFHLDNYDVVLPAAAWISAREATFYTQQEGECLTYVLPFTPFAIDPPDIAIGFPFLSTVYTVLKYGETPQIGFAPLADAGKAYKPQRIEGNATRSAPAWHSVVPVPTASAVSGATAVGMSALAAVFAAAAHFL